jgi:hypothetical protein
VKEKSIYYFNYTIFIDWEGVFVGIYFYMKGFSRH